MSFVRPEVKSAIWQWRGPLQGAIVAGFGLWFFFTSFTIFKWLGVLVAVLGLMLIWTGVIRARFQVRHDGPGVVDILERRVTWFGPDTGVSFSLDDVTRIEIETGGAGAGDIVWLFHHLPDEPVARIPGSAAAADDLFDALAGFPEVNYENAVRASRSTRRDLLLIWQKGD